MTASIKLFTSAHSPDGSPFFVPVSPPPPVSPLARYSTFLDSLGHSRDLRSFPKCSLVLIPSVKHHPNAEMSEIMTVSKTQPIISTILSASPHEAARTQGRV